MTRFVEFRKNAKWACFIIFCTHYIFLPWFSSFSFEAKYFMLSCFMFPAYQSISSNSGCIWAQTDLFVSIEGVLPQQACVLTRGQNWSDV